ncbi:hypothetical protein LJY25_19140 [Hymenobacter sp. BT175]|uniref:hypothetical protein n=1 Tax=Hymenobacter translucens TaxID=2886507 RepID=UPI001D0E333B|nr:hypothetical protein [Hymenobacter translucens]MCC2548571.1 hypothetical protein [Hymenobacter translucens]
MRLPFYSFLLGAISLGLGAHAQTPITIVSADLPAAGDTLRLSNAAPTLPMGAPPLSRNGANQTWNYSTLQHTGQTVDRYVTVPALFQLAFGLLGGVNRASQASPEPLPIPGLPVTETYNFYNKSTADYRSVGFGAVVSGLPVTATYQSQALQDVVYRLPITYGRRDSSNSVLVAEMQGILYFERTQKRVNRADGWGTLTTPFGTFAVLRVVSTMTGSDSIALAGAPGVPVPRHERQYKWLARSQRVPLLTIITTVTGTAETITAVQYRDTYRRPRTISSTRDAATDAALSAYPNPSAVGSPLTLTVPQGSGQFTVLATDLAGRQLFSRRLNGSSGTLHLDGADFGPFRGVALLTVTTAQGTATRRVARF